MTWNRYAKKKDKTQQAIVEAIRKAGWIVWDIGLPVDLLCWKPDRGFKLLECKTPDAKGRVRDRSDRKTQTEFCELTGTPRVTTPEDALKALGDIHAIA